MSKTTSIHLFLLKKGLLAFLVLLAVHKTLVWTQPFGSLLQDKAFSQEVLDKEGRLLRISLAEDEAYRVFTPLEEISPLLVEGTLLFEDQYFYYHLGVNPVSLLRALWITFVKKSRRVGASTITMQLARKLYGLSTRSVSGKLQQILYSFYLEFLYSKKEILEAYLNIAPYGYNIEGVGAASRIYFNRPIERATLIEALTLSVIPQSPYQRTRHVNEQKLANADLKQARNQLFAMWLKAHPGWSEKKEEFDLDVEMRPPRDLPFLAPHLTTELLLTKDRSRLETTLDYPLQSMFESQTQSYLERHRKLGFENAAVLLIDTRSMETLAYVGSAEFGDENIMGQVNGLTARRSPGSALKPFVYGMAIEQGLIHPLTMLKDTRTPFGTYTPDNFDKEFAGPLSATDALVLSRNIPAINLALKLEGQGLYGFLQKAEVPLVDDPEHYGLSIILGSAEVSMVELVGLYAALKNDGQWQPVRLLKSEPKKEAVNLLSKEAAFLVLDMLAKNQRPEMEKVNRFSRQPVHVPWKTGTSVGYRDAWSVAVFDHYALGVWIGNFSGKGNNEFVGRKAAGPLLFRLIDSLREVREVNLSQQEPPLDYNLEKLAFCGRSGHLPNSHCPHREQGWFVPGVSPISRCDIHRKIQIDPVSGMQVCPRFTGQKNEEVFEYWPSDLLKLFKEAGIGRKTPPALHDVCKGVAYGDIAPKILSPQPRTLYSLRSKGTGTKEIPLMAVADGSIRTLTWFVNNRKLGTSEVDKPYLWKAVAGDHRLRVVDDHGRSSELFFQVKKVD